MHEKRIRLLINSEFRLGYVRQYLYLVPQDRKFCSSAPSEIIWQSARWIPNFSALKAASAFEAIEKYAANLINQPWRKEYKTIKVQFTLIVTILG